MFTIIHTEMKQVTYVMVGIGLLGWVLDKLGIESSTMKPEFQTLIFVAMWFGLVAYRSVEKLAEQEKS